MGTVRAVEDQPHACCHLCSVRGRYARKLADLMGLRDWVVEVAHDPPRADARATCELAPERRLLRLRFCEGHERLDPHEQRHDFVHELIHPLLRDFYETVKQTAHEEFGGAAFRVFMSQVVREKEKAVDKLAGVIAPHMPVIEWLDV